MKKKFSPWPVGIVLYFLSFIGLVIFFVINATDVRFDLVTDDYYAQELKHEDKMAAMHRAEQLESKPQVDLQGDTLRVEVPEALANQIAQPGQLKVYRASDKRQDILTEWDPRESFALSLSGKLPGRYEIQLSWNLDGKDYYVAEEIFLETL